MSLIKTETNISYGYKNLLEIFFKANELDVMVDGTTGSYRKKIILYYEQDSETEQSILFLSLKHLGFENMLCDYLHKCGIDFNMIPIGKEIMKRDMKTLDKECDEHLRDLGFRR